MGPRSMRRVCRHGAGPPCGQRGVWWTHYGAANRVKGAPQWGGAAARALPLGPQVGFLWGHETRHAGSGVSASVGLPMGPRSVRGEGDDDD
eukprot:7365151-Pyramimonas_sp.AAC.1